MRHVLSALCVLSLAFGARASALPPVCDDCDPPPPCVDDCDPPPPPPPPPPPVCDGTQWDAAHDMADAYCCDNPNIPDEPACIDSVVHGWCRDSIDCNQPICDDNITLRDYCIATAAETHSMPAVCCTLFQF
jgi:hypothetical protein